MFRISRRDFLRLSTSALAGLAISPFAPLASFDDSQQVRVATKSVSIYSEPNDQSLIMGQKFRDELVNIYREVDAGVPTYNPIWYRVWGGYMHRAYLQKVKILFNEPLTAFAEDTKQLTEVTVPFTQAMRYSKAYGWQPNLRLYYGSVHWIGGVEEGPDGEAWYRILDDLVGFPYHAKATHLRAISSGEWAPLNPERTLEDKRIEVSLGSQTLTAYEYDQVVFQTKISSGIATAKRNPGDLPTKTPVGEFRIISKYPSKHMGNGNLFATTEDYELPGVPWTSFFHEAGYAFHGTYWHDNFGVPMSRGCVNMRIPEAKWLFQWVHPLHNQDRVYTPGNGTRVIITS
jgi:lipoprotein-anchoring transpeptidase ErfK/SrfK